MRFIVSTTTAIGLAMLSLAVVFWVFQPVAAQSPAGGAFIWPLSGTVTPDVVSSPFGPRWQASQERYDYHPGMDLPAPQNTPVHVITDGVVTEVGWLSASAGLGVVVHHPGANLYSAYLHLNSASVSVSDTVTQGQVIGAVGNTGVTDFMHLHFEIRLTPTNYPTATRNPMGYLPRPDTATPTIRIGSINSDPIYSPTVSLVITAARAELDVNAITVTVRDKSSGALLETRVVDFNRRIPTGADALATADTRLLPSHFNTATTEYELTANFDLHTQDGLTITAETADLTGHTASVTQVVNDATPPAAIDTLSAEWRADGGVALRWVAPGDSGMVGTAAQYDIRYSNAPIDSFSWYSATPVPSPPAPLAGGLVQTFTVSGPLSTPVYFAIKTSDSEGNLSLLSNSAQAHRAWQVFLPVIIK